jgi:DNA-directed RNA polymerase subunit RPC12/RpoP
MNEVRTCTRCSGRMAEATAEIFGNIFGCTREPKNLEALPGERIQSYYCEDCGHIEFYKEKKE